MGFVQEAKSSYSRRRRRRQWITLAVVALLLLGVFGYAGAYYKGWVGNGGRVDVSSLPPCPPTTAPTLTPADVKVNVLNSTGRDGLALAASKSLVRRGYVIGSVDNAPGAPVLGVAEIRYGAQSVAAARLLAKDVHGAKLVVVRRVDPSIDLVVGEKWVGLKAPAPTPTATPSVPSTPCRTVTPVPTTRPTVPRSVRPTTAKTPGKRRTGVPIPTTPSPR